eukprot:64554_1
MELITDTMRMSQFWHMCDGNDELDNEPLIVNTSEDNNIQQSTIQLHSDYIKYFKLKLHNTNQNCCICCNTVSCCTLYVGAHIWFAVWLILAICNMFETIFIRGLWDEFATKNIFLCSFGIFASISAVAGLHLCQPVCIRIFMLFLTFYFGYRLSIILQVLIFQPEIVTISLLLYNLLDIIMVIWTFLSVTKIYAWCVYFRKGGAYDRNMAMPIEDNILQQH